jgi:RecB family exonuclease
VRAADAGGFREALVSLAAAGDPLAARHRLVIVPTRAAAGHLIRAIERRLLTEGGAALLPDFVTPAELPARFAARIEDLGMAADDARREVLLGVACQEAIEAGAKPPFRLRPALVAEILRFYDTLRRHRRDVETFERLALGALEPGADTDRGAERLVRQTRFLVAAFRRFEAQCVERGWVDEHSMRRAAIDRAASRPWTHVVVAVGDRSRDAHGLYEADWDLLARVPGLEQLDVVVTDTKLAGAFHEQIHALLPGIEEVRFEAPAMPHPSLRAPEDGGLAIVARDREEEIASFARWARGALRSGVIGALDEMALVVRQPLPYVYLTRDVLRSAGIPTQTYDTLPLAGEPYAAALDLVFSAVSANFARGPIIALLRSPHLRFGGDAGILALPAIAALDRALSEAGYLGDLSALEPLVEKWRADAPEKGAIARASAAADVLLDLARDLAALREAGAVADQIGVLLRFLREHENLPGPEDPLRTRQLRARAAILGILTSLRDAYAELDDRPVPFDDTAGLVRRWIEGHTFSPRSGDTGVHLVDAESARFGDFACVQLAGLVDGEWPERPRRNVFYTQGVLRDLGWPAEADRLDGARAEFVDLLTLPTHTLTLSTFALEDDAVVAASALIDEAARVELERVPVDGGAQRIFEYEALGFDPALPDAIDPAIGAVASRRLGVVSAGLPARGATAGHKAAAFSLSALERYQDCPFKFFAQDVLRLEEAPEDETSLSPRERGRFIHEVFQRFFERWGAETVTPARFEAARALFVEVAEELLTRLPDADAALERARLFGSAIATGIVDVVLGLEAARPDAVRERWLEHRLEGEFVLGGADGRRVPLRGVADRIDLLSDNRLRVIDYKSGYAPEPRRALQVPIYALCAKEQLAARGQAEWDVDEAAYIAFTGKRTLVPVVRPGSSERDSILAAARERLLEALDGIDRGEFPPRPYEPRICGYCAYASVCRKDYVGDE